MANLISETEAAKILGLTVSALQKWRRTKKGPAYFRVGGAIRYSPDELDRFIQAGRVEPTVNQ